MPVADGGIQIEWHERSGELELSISPEGEASLWGHIHSTDQKFEGEGQKALALFFYWAPQFASANSNGIDTPPAQDSQDAVG